MQHYNSLKSTEYPSNKDLLATQATLLRLLRFDDLFSDDDAVSESRAERIAHRFETLQKRHELAAVLPSQ
jgi:hypothetical protein